MERFIIKNLQEWRSRPNRKPLVLNGARQVGKTWLLKSFGKTSFRNLAYVAFDGNPALVEFFKSGYSDIKRLITGLQAATGTMIVPEETLIVFDEVQLCPEALTSLKYWQENPFSQLLVFTTLVKPFTAEAATSWIVFLGSRSSCVLIVVACGGST